MKNHFKKFLTLSSLLIAYLSQQTLMAENQYLVSEVDGGMPYLLHVPDEYDDNPDKSYPTIIYLHGYGERCAPASYGTTDELADLENASGTPARLIRDGYTMAAEVDGVTEYFIVISPQIRSSRGHWNAADVVALLDEVSANVRVDPDRVYLTGFSFGGTGVWRVLTESANEPNRFAAAAPICGWSNVSSKHGTIAENKVALWSMSGLSDPTEHTPERVLISNRELRKHLPEVDHFVTLYPGVGHSNNRSYNLGNTFHDPNLYQWFLQQSLQTPGLTPRTNLADRSETTATAGDVQGSYGAGRVKNNTNTFWGSDTDNYDNKWVMLDLGQIEVVDQVYLRFASSTSASLQPTAPHGEIASIEASPTSGRLRIYAPDHARRAASTGIPGHRIWIKDSDGYDGGSFEIVRVNSSSSTNPDGWFEIEGEFTADSTGTWYCLNETVVDYQLEGSENGSDWTLLADIDENYEYNRQHKFEPTAMRYVRLKIERANRMDLPEFEHISKVYEFKVLETVEAVDPPSAPTSLLATNVTSGGVDLQWSAATGVVNDYLIYWSQDSTQPDTPQASISGSETTYTATGLSSNTTYNFWVSANNSGGESSAATTSATTLELLPPAAPTSLNASGISANGLTLSWIDEADNETAYHIFWSETDTQPGSPSATIDADSSSVFVSDLNAETTYYFWVEAVNSEGASAAASTSATTLEPSGSLGVDLLSHWKFDETTGSTAYDTAGLNDGALNGDITRLDDGISEHALTFDGTDDWVEAPHKEAYSTTALSISMWVRPSAIDSQPRGLISKRSGTGSSQRAFSLFSYAAGRLYIDIGADRVMTNYFLNEADAWKHIAVVFDGNSAADNVILYIDGAAVYTGTIAATAIPSINAPITIGILNTNYGDSFNGDIDEVRIYGRALLASEVEYLYGNEPTNNSELPASFSEWAADKLTDLSVADQSADADPDGDSITNLMEYALQMDPLLPDMTELPSTEIVEDGLSKYLQFQFRCIADGTGSIASGYTAGGLQYLVLVSQSLAPDSWTTGETLLEQIGESTINEDGSTNITVRVIAPIDDATPCFVRLQVSEE
ncbi:LamG-like jellyroll fold domain-containing protein [Cerasicoccus maritimus]|uniref:LamG-like jellyroll fold domain-containing protein n=1 Tax=Cerasicoccus maritimus TaxID=490089 RepID=UPI002852D01A|nr:LamG-like jellyroll fold domain-containing protein [Cerasicoccus maritimus]